MLSKPPRLPPSAREVRPFGLGAISGTAMGWFSCFIFLDPRHWYWLAAWVMLTFFWSTYFPTRRTRVQFLLGSLFGLLVTFGVMVLLIHLVRSEFANWSVAG